MDARSAIKKTARPGAPGLWRSVSPRRGQILVPTLFILPSLLLFVYLLFETTKLSREKIRQQFAVDSAAFIQMGDYTNLLNRTAYVNGAFPYRIFKEAYECPNPETPLHNADGSGTICPYDMLYAAGAFPKSKDDVKGAPPESLDKRTKWEIAFDDTVRPEFTGNPSSKQDRPVLELITQDQGVKIMLEWGTAIGYYKFYSQVYSLLGNVEKSQFTVFERLTESFNFFRKSYYLNANTPDCVSNPQTCGNDGIFSGGGFDANRLVEGQNFFMHYTQKIMFYAKVFTGGTLPPYYLGKTNPPMDMTSMDPAGLFQLATITDDRLDKFGRGLDVFQGWDAPSNFFNINFNTIARCNETGRPCVHAMVTSQCPQLTTAGNNCVWPNPTPKYQTRLYP
ncbi:MAG: hypothetical protein COX65_01230 [Elusimicrobia bacterium CG_4_10_14_0_2_um_filter_56_8]|nr:MAG: hypothetical protein AUJ51_11705 [Elusimicrobia bacterium CG1_02_56_21]PJA17170.1 MAG: hypothetical protein COX65_01230 [Elusimicrobia bacterium CG_4_10_14_0_2_um_filter_56_8]